MREILFRGKRKEDDEWVYGFLVSQKHIGDWVTAYPVNPDTVGQFTGLTDKNGKKIFEWDILKGLELFLVEFREGGFVLMFGDGGMEYIHEHCVDRFEVIGNIHDNPELLGGSDHD